MVQRERESRRWSESERRALQAHARMTHRDLSRCQEIDKILGRIRPCALHATQLHNTCEKKRQKAKRYIGISLS